MRRDTAADTARQLRGVLAAVENGYLEVDERSSRLVPMMEGIVVALEVVASVMCWHSISWG